jgi:hypothetical protein
MQTLLRINYMASTAWSSIGLVFLLAYPFDSKLLSPLIVLAALPYFLAMASDLKRCGYKRVDVFRIYGFNLMLLPVNLSGVFKSVQQAVSGKKIPFARTPKVRNRTASPALFALSPLVIIAYSGWTLWRDIDDHNWGNAVFAGFNATATFYAVCAFMGLRFALLDIWLGLRERMYVADKPPVVPERRRRSQPAVTGVETDWRDVIYRGAAATSSGLHLGDGVGPFRILATQPTAPPQHNRRAADRIPPVYNRRSSDRRGGSAADRAPADSIETEDRH